jgi:fatty acid desaturase
MASVQDGWFACQIDRKELKALMSRSDATGLRWFTGWFAAVIASGVLAYLSLGTLWAVPAFALYGVLFCFAEPIAHECTHGTPFRSRWLNETVHFMVGLVMIKEPTFHRWMHARHHTHTIMVGQDPEIQVPRPTNPWTVLGEFTGLRPVFNFAKALVRNALGAFTAETRAWVPESEHPKLVSGARIYLAIYLAVVLLAIAVQSWVVFLFFPLPRLYGCWMKTLLTMTQHAGLEEDVKDHRRSTRTVYMNPLFRFLYWNMNYHTEHHMYPTVPYHALPKLHEKLKDQLPRPYNGLAEAYREMATTFIRQQKDPSYFVRPVLPDIESTRA